jgi:DNA-directed RNA polymerase subunit K/omega
MVNRPMETNAFEFVIVSALRAKQLMRGCTPRVLSTHKIMMTAQLEVAAGKIDTVMVPIAPQRRLRYIAANGGSHVETV